MSDKETSYPGSLTFRVSYKDGKTQEYQSSEHKTVDDFVRSTFGDVDLKENNVKVELVQITKPAAAATTPAAKPAVAKTTPKVEVKKEEDGQPAPKPE